MFYNKELDFYVCPMGQRLELFWKLKKETSDLGYTSTKSLYQAKDAPTAHSGACATKASAEPEL